MIHKKTKLVLGIATATLTLAGAMVSPEALAHKSSKKHYHDTHYYGTKHTHKKAKTYKAKAYKAESASTYVAPAPVAAAPYDDSALKQRIAELEARKMPEAAPAKESKDNMVFFRGGWSHSNRERNGISIYNGAVLRNADGTLFQGDKADKNAWYFGAGLDFSVDDNLFGLMDNTEVLGEIMFEYKEFANKVYGNALTGNLMDAIAATTGTTPSGIGTAANRDVTVSQFTLTASPKIKFLKGHDFRPWIIPIGFAMNVISPPSTSITVLQPAMMFGVGADYKLWKNIYLGADARYHQALSNGGVDGVSTNGFTVGGYLGLGF